MEEKRKKSIKIRNLVLTILTRLVQIGVLPVLFKMTIPIHNAAEKFYGEPKTFLDEKSLNGSGLLLLVLFFPAVLVIEYIRLLLVIKLSGKTQEEYGKYLIDRMPPGAVERAKSYEANSEELKAYLNSIKDESGFTKDEVTWLFIMFLDLKKDKERESAEKRKAEEEEKAKREEERREYGPSFSERIRKEAEETSKRPEDIKHNNPL